MGSRRSHMDVQSASGEVCMSNMSKAGSITFELPKPLMLNREVWSTTREDKFVLDSVGGSFKICVASTMAALESNFYIFVFSLHIACY